MKTLSLILCLLILSYAGLVQFPSLTQGQVVEQQSDVPIYKVTVVARSIKAINYRHRSGATKVDLRGTALLPNAHGVAKIESKQGVIKIDVNLQKLSSANQYGLEYLTYVMWAITPEGRAINVGELLLDEDKSSLSATVELQSFGLIVTAEPYYAVTQPSDVVIMENFVRQDTVGKVEEVDAKYELIQRGQYTLNMNPSYLKPIKLGASVPLELYEARNAIELVRWVGAEKYATDTFQKALKNLQMAESYFQRKAGRKPIITMAREAIQMAEDARLITVKRITEEEIAQQQAASAQKEALAKAEAEEKAKLAKEEMERREQAEAERAISEKAKQDAEKAKQEAELAKQNAQVAAEIATKKQAEAEASRLAALEQQRIAETEAVKARLNAEEANRLRQKLEKEQVELRAQLLKRLNQILDTKDTERGIVVNMSEVLFESGKYSLRPTAREKLAKISGILLAYPGLRLVVEGHTDNLGNTEFNQKLSEKRAASVRDYLCQQGISINDVVVVGLGELMPISYNSTAAGRKQNRRVELIVSGEVIGTKFGRSN